MSDIWLAVALSGTFFFFLAGGIALDMTFNERNRAVRLLESQVTGSASSSENINLREKELAQNFGKRVLAPAVVGAGRIARRFTPIDARARISKKLPIAG